MDLKIGMYVRCPIDQEYPDDPRRFALGQVIKIDSLLDNISVRFHDTDGIINYYGELVGVSVYKINRIERSRILANSRIKYSYYEGRIKSFSHEDDEGFYVYYIELLDGNEKNIIKIPENKLIAQFSQGDVNPIRQLRNYEFHNPSWYFRRRVVSKLMNIISNSSFGFEYLVGSRVHLLSHQVETVVKALSEKQCRLMLADEVGMGKTIEACAILSGLKEQVEIMNTLLLVPLSLAVQWKNELFYKFNIKMDIWKPGIPIDTDMIVTMDQLEIAKEKGLFENDWDLCIVDETHNLLKNPNHYNIVKDISENITHILLLSATPVLERKAEYLELLRLLKPKLYNNMSMEEFENMITKYSQIQEIVYPLIEDIEYYIEDELYDDYIEDLGRIGDILKNKQFSNLVNGIDTGSEDYGLNDIRVCLAYISEYYQIEKHIIRHRRKIIEEDMAKRKLEEYSYEMVGGERLFYEQTVYDQLKEFIKAHLLKEQDLNQKKEIKDLLSGVFSSPWALLEILDENDNNIEFKSESYMEDLSILRKLCKNWEEAVLEEFNNYQDLYDNPDKIKGRLLYILDYLREELDDTKIVIFSQFTSTILRFEELIKTCFGSEAYTCFHKHLDYTSLNENADRFQEDRKCRFILCDELGGEGRNFQIADKIVHIDLPWSANDLEQRIGRLDRLGRSIDKDVLSVVFYSKDTIEEGLFNIWNKGLNLFNNSLSGLEIVLGELNELILDSLYKDLDYGLFDTLDNIIEKVNVMKDYIKKEEYYDIGSQLDRDTEDMLYKLIESFTKHNKDTFYDSMMSWAMMAGLNANRVSGTNDIVIFDPKNFSIRSAENTLLIPPDWTSYSSYFDIRRTYDIRGTFNRSLAIEREDLLFFAPSDPVFDSIVTNALSCSLGKSSAMSIEGDFDFTGFVFTWSIGPNINFLLDLNADLVYLSRFRGYLPLEQIITIIPIDEKFKEDNLYEYKILKLLDEERNIYKYKHLGKRGKSTNLGAIRAQSNIEEFKSAYNKEMWSELIDQSIDKSLDKLYKKVKYESNIKAAKKEMEKILYANKASGLFFENELENNKRMKEIYNAIYRGLNNPQTYLDSAIFLKVVKSND